MSISLKIGMDTLSGKFRERYSTEFKINEQRKNQRENENAQIVTDRLETMAKNRADHKEKIYDIYGNQPYLIKA